MKTHVAVPFAEKLKGDLFKIYFCVRDKKNRSHITYAIYDFKKKSLYKRINKIPILKPGKLGTFDENGVTPSWITKYKKNKYIFYVGWNTGGNTRMSLFTGVGIIKKKRIVRFQESPLLERNKVDPFLTATNCVLKENKKFKMWYVSGDGWTIKSNETFPKYNIKYAESKDCINWKRKGKICVDYKSSNEFALARPSILKIKKQYFLWYSYKAHGKNYKIGFAKSKDGLKWFRRDNDLIFKPNKRYKWENEMQAYPHVFLHKKQIYMLYNGNGYGKTGIALARLKSKII